MSLFLFVLVLNQSMLQVKLLFLSILILKPSYFKSPKYETAKYKLHFRYFLKSQRKPHERSPGKNRRLW